MYASLFVFIIYNEIIDYLIITAKTKECIIYSSKMDSTLLWHI